MYFRLLLVFLPLVSSRALPRARFKNNQDHKIKVRLQELSPIKVNTELQRFQNFPNMNVRREGPLIDQTSLSNKFDPSNVKVQWINLNRKPQRIKKHKFKKMKSSLPTVPINIIKYELGTSQEFDAPSYLDQKRINIYKKVINNKDKKRNAIQWLQKHYQSIERSDELDQAGTRNTELSEVLNELGKIVELKQIDEDLDKREKEELPVDIFDKNGMYYVTKPKERGPNLNYLIEKIVDYRNKAAARTSHVPLVELFSPAEAQRIKTIARAIDEEDKSFEEFNQALEDQTRLEKEDELAEQQNVQDLLIDSSNLKKKLARALDEKGSGDPDPVVLDFDQLVV